MKPISRRQFLEQSLLAAAAAAGTGLATEAFAAPGRGRRVGQNEKIQMACIGFRGQGMSHIGSYARRKDAVVVALCDADRDQWGKGVKAVEENGKNTPKTYQDIRRLLEDKEIDAVSIAMPNHWHALAAIWAMQAGKDVYVEKPVSHNVSEGRRMVQAARKYGKICQTGTQIRSQQGAQQAMEYIHSGKIGKVTLARGLCYKSRPSIGKTEGPQPVPASVDYDLWIGPAPMKQPRRNGKFGPIHYDWHWVWDYGNGDLGNQGIHQMDVARWALKKNSLPKTALGLGGRFGYEDDGETPNTELCFFDYGDAQLIFEVRGLPTKDLRGAKVGNIIYGAEGYVVFPGYSNAIAFDNEHNEVARFDGGGDHHGNFLDACRSRKHTDLTADIEEGHLSSALCHLGNISYLLGKEQPFNTKTKAFGDDGETYETFGRFEEHLAENGLSLQEASYRLGPSLKINRKTERFEGNSEANALLTREYRQPFVVPEKL